MDRALAGIDHLIIGVRDLEAARRDYARLGFNTSPRGRHRGWGTANYCVMFEDDYLELLGIVDPTQFTNYLDEFLEQREGLLAIVAGSRDADRTAEAWRSSGVASAVMRPLSRLLELEQGPVELEFGTVMLDEADRGGVNYFACEHRTPDALRRKAWLVHPNGAFGIRSVTVLVDDPVPLADAFSKLYGSGAISRTDGIRTIQTGGAPIVLASPEDAMMMHPGFDIPESAPRPLPLAIEIRVADIERARQFLTLQGVAFAPRTGRSLCIQPAEAHGVMLEMSEG